MYATWRLGRRTTSTRYRQNLFLRIPSQYLWHFHRACDDWNNLRNERRRAFLRAIIPEPGFCILTAPRRVLNFNSPLQRIAESNIWQLLDIETNQVCFIRDTFLRQFLVTRLGVVVFARLTMAASGGLIYVVYYMHDKHRTPCNLVCNPGTKRFHWIPNFGLRLGVTNPAAMMVETTTQRYVIAVMECTPPTRCRRPPVLHVYDSRIWGWRVLRYPICPAEYLPRSLVVFDGLFYTLFEHRQRRQYIIFALDVENGSWRAIINLILCQLPRPPDRWTRSRAQLVAAGSRLFFVTFTAPADSQGVAVAIWRIFLCERSTATRVTRHPRLFANSGLRCSSMTSAPLAIGCGDYVVVSTVAGCNRARWDVFLDEWQPLEPFVPITRDSACHSFFVAPFEYSF